LNKQAYRKGQFTNLYLDADGRMHAWRKLYQRKEKVKISWMQKLYNKLWEARQRLLKDNKHDLSYPSGMMLKPEPLTKASHSNSASEK
jgi:hypothetical protein